MRSLRPEKGFPGLLIDGLAVQSHNILVWRVWTSICSPVRNRHVPTSVSVSISSPCTRDLMLKPPERSSPLTLACVAERRITAYRDAPSTMLRAGETVDGTAGYVNRIGLVEQQLQTRHPVLRQTHVRAGRTTTTRPTQTIMVRRERRQRRGVRREARTLRHDSSYQSNPGPLQRHFPSTGRSSFLAVIVRGGMMRRCR